MSTSSVSGLLRSSAPSTSVYLVVPIDDGIDLPVHGDLLWIAASSAKSTARGARDSLEDCLASSEDSTPGSALEVPAKDR